MPSKEERREALKAVYDEARVCTRCPQLVESRQTVVFGAGNADADLMFVGEAPGANEDKVGLPFVGQAGKLLEKLLGEIGLQREDVFIANVLKCLRYNTPVQLADGSWERVGRLVRNRFAGEVMSVDEAGSLVPRKVVGWHATPLAGRSVFRMTYRSAKRAGAGRIGIELTGDHPVLTERGFVPVAQLAEGDRVATGQGLSDVAFDVVCGTVLGDGTLQRASPHLSLSHCLAQGDYAHFKQRVLKELGARVDLVETKAVVGGSPGQIVVHVRTVAHRALRRLRADFYGDRKRVPGWLAQRLNARMLAIWFMDDGHLRIRPPRQPSAELATVGFSGSDVAILRQGLLRMGLPTQYRGGRIQFDVHSTPRLSELIAPFVPPSMRYKLVPAIADRIPFDPGLYEAGPARVFYDEIEVEDITARERKDVTFFCIDVEDTHNFVTSGGVVHNCRPPGNRDPHPVEIDKCQAYLMRQVELIEPRVICTLGNFATKLLRADPTGITRLHGQAEIRVLGERAVRLYPLFHPAAALYTPSNVEVLREDFARIPDLLALPMPEQPGAPEPAIPEPELATEPESTSEHEPIGAAQLGLF